MSYSENSLFEAAEWFLLRPRHILFVKKACSPLSLWYNFLYLALNDLDQGVLCYNSCFAKLVHDSSCIQ